MREFTQKVKRRDDELGTSNREGSNDTFLGPGGLSTWQDAVIYFSVGASAVRLEI